MVGNRDDRKGERIRGQLRTAERHAGPVKAAGRVHPAQVSNQTLIAEHELLPPCTQRDGRLRAADVGVREPQVELVPERRPGRADVLVAHPGVLPLHGDAEQGMRSHGCIEPESREPVHVVAVRSEAEPVEALEPLAELSAHPEPFRKHVVQAVRHRGLRRSRLDLRGR